MNVNEVDIGSIIINISRFNENLTEVEVIFEHNDLTISGSIHCRYGLQAERNAQDKILTCFGFSKDVIDSLHYD